MFALVIYSSSGILDNDTFDEYAVVIYMAVLRRMVSCLQVNKRYDANACCTPKC